MRILNFGSLNIDYIYRVSEFPKPGETIISAGYDREVGGKGLNQSIAIKRSGSDVFHAGRIGSDGEILTVCLRGSGVNTDFVQIGDDKTGHALIEIADDGENCIILFSGANHSIDKASIDKTLNQFSAGDFLVLQNEINNVDYLVEKASEKGMITFFNIAPFTEEVRSIPLKSVHYIMVNELELEALTGSEVPEAGFEFLKKENPDVHVLVTLGAKGAFYFHGDEKVFQPAFPVDTVDSTGAGDTFIGYFVGGLSRGETVKAAMETAAKAAAIAVTRAGASAVIPTMDQVRRFQSI